MVKTILFITLLLFSFSIPARCYDRTTEKTIMNPSFKARSGSIYTITKAELTDTHTKLFTHVVFRPHWWLCPDSTIYLEDVETGVRYPATGIEGMKFGERFFMPDSGETEVVFIFPPLPASVKTVNWINPTSAEERTFGIDLTKDGTGSVSSSKMDKWLAQHPQPGIPTDTDKEFTRFFNPDTTYITGILDHYDPILGFDTGIIYVHDMLEDKDRPTVVKIHPDGRLEGKFFLDHPSRCFMLIGNNNSAGSIYVEPGKTLSLYIDFEDLLARNRARNMDYPLEHIMYGDNLGEVNRQLAGIPVFPLDYQDMQELKSKLSPMQMREKCDDAIASWKNGLAQYMEEKQVSPKVRQLLEMQGKVYGAFWLLDYAMDYSYEKSRDTVSATKDPFPMEFYSFLREIPLDDEKILAADCASSFINRFSYMSWIQEQTEKKIKERIKDISPSGWNPSHMAEMMFYQEKIQTEILMDYLGKGNIPFLWQLVLCNKLCSRLNAQADNLMERKNPMTVQTISGLKDSIGTFISHPVLKQKIEDSYQHYMQKQPYQLPPCEGTDIFRKITEPYQGKVLLVDFWATTCGPCRYAIENSTELRARWRGNKDVQFIFITAEDESPEQTYREYVEKNLKGEAVFRIPTSDYQRLRELFGFNGIPRYMLVGREGEIISDDYHNIYFPEALEKDLETLGVNTDIGN